MAEIMKSGAPAADKRFLLAYVQHMARTAQCDSTKRIFEKFAWHEKRRIEASGGLQFPG